MITIHTVAEARAEGLIIPGFAKCEEPDEFLLAHDADGSVVAWGPAWDRPNLIRIVKGL